MKITSGRSPPTAKKKTSASYKLAEIVIPAKMLYCPLPLFRAVYPTFFYLIFKTMKWFSECKSTDEVKTVYKKLAKQYHPDLGGDTLTMQEINKEYAFACAKAFRDANLSEEETEKEMNFSEQYREVIEQIIHLEGIVVELVGYWIWVTGHTYPFRAELKASGLRFACKKQAWYFCSDEFRASKWSKKTLEEIRNKYGTELIREDKRKRIAS